MSKENVLMKPFILSPKKMLWRIAGEVSEAVKLPADSPANLEFHGGRREPTPMVGSDLHICMCAPNPLNVI